MNQYFGARPVGAAPASRRLAALGLAGLMTILAPQPAAAQDLTPTPPSPAPNRPELAPTGGLTGDWGGLRTRLKDGGVTLTADYTSEIAGNATGGARRTATETGQFGFGAVFDTGKLFGLDGGSVHTALSFRRGYDISARAGLGTLQQPQEVFGRGQTSRLSQLFYEQTLGPIVDVKVGRMTMGDDFAARGCDSSNLTFCGSPMGNLVGDYWYNGPVSQWGAQLRVKPRGFSLLVGVFEYNPNNLNPGIAISHGGAKGVTVPVELGWSPKLGRAGLPGLYRVGSWYNDARFPDVYLGQDGRPFGLSGLAPLEQRGRYGGYVVIQQQLTGRSVDTATGPVAIHGLSLSAALVKVDERAQRLDSQISAGLTYVGAIPGRPYDAMSINIGRTHVNPRSADAEALTTPGGDRPGAEYASEFYYGLHLFPWLLVSPNVQYIVHPGGYATARDVVVFGVKTSLKL